MGSTVLIVEDDPSTAKLVALYLNRDGHKVMTAANGVDGLRLAREARPDLLVLDLMLPKLDGIEITRALRDDGSDVPIIMLTARVEEEDRLTGLDLGADDYVTKPFSPKELAARVRAVLRRSAREAEKSGPFTAPLESHAPGSLAFRPTANARDAVRMSYESTGPETMRVTIEFRETSGRQPVVIELARVE